MKAINHTALAVPGALSPLEIVSENIQVKMSPTIIYGHHDLEIREASYLLVDLDLKCTYVFTFLIIC